MKLLGLFMSKTMMGILLSMQRLKAVESMTWQTFRERFVVADAVVALRVGIFLRIAVVDAVHFGGLENDVGAHLARAQRGGGVGGEIGIAGAGDEDDDAAQSRGAEWRGRG